MIKVYHNPQFLDNPFLRDPIIAAEIAGSKDLELVANVDTNDLNKAFSLTNHIETDWRENEGVTFVGKFNSRSTSVGDVFELDGVRHVVAACGFIAIENGVPV